MRSRHLLTIGIMILVVVTRPAVQADTGQVPTKCGAGYGGVPFPDAEGEFFAQPLPVETLPPGVDPDWWHGVTAQIARDMPAQDRDPVAARPLTIPTLLGATSWTAESDQFGAHFGVSVATAGDVNGDGFSDVIVGAHLYDNGETDEGRAYLYLGSPEGPAGAPTWTVESDQPGAGFGVSVATAGDVNGDGFSDVIVGAHLYDNGETDGGRAYVYLGSAKGLADSPSWMVESHQPGAGFGISVAMAGDVNGDGFSDVIVGADLYDGDEIDEGRAWVYLGSAEGLSGSPSWTADGDQAGARFGSSVATAGDVNADGFSDVIIGASHYDNTRSDGGRAYVYHGSATGLAGTQAWMADGDETDACFGSSVAAAGDVNGDGYSDVIIGTGLYDNGRNKEERAFVYHGSATGLAVAADWATEDYQPGATFGRSVAAAGDVNGDGFSDVIIGADLFGGGDEDEGRAFVYFGSEAGLAPVSGWTAESDQIDARFGCSVGTAGDVNGDGFSDVIIGADLFDGSEEDEGRAFVYLGSAAGLARVSGWTGESDHFNASFGYSVGTAGDVNGDGFSDVVVGAYRFDNGQAYEGAAFVYHGSPTGLEVLPAWTGESDQRHAYYGISAGTAGDVNGDGFSDVIVGARMYDSGQSEAGDEGRAYLYLGSSQGLAALPAWTADGDQAGAWFGRSVGTAGDVNGDGFSDVIVGANFYGETDEGRAYVYYGSPAGLSAAPAWMAKGSQPYAFLGYSVGTAGDVNGDGFSDVVVGSHFYDGGETDEGQVLVYHGSAQGLGTSPAWTAEGDQASASFGRFVAAAGDVNGDGFSDLIIGADLYDSEYADEGRAYVYHGSPAGLSVAPAWIAEGSQPNAYLGYSVGTAGDVNGDGFSDVVVGAFCFDNGEQDEGRTFAYYGSASGLGDWPAWTAESDQAGAFFGVSVATAGDVNGDGFSDVIVGAMRYSNGQAWEGRAYTYYGNEGDGLHRAPNQARLDDSAPIALLGRSDSENAFRLEVLGRTPAGRGRVRLEREVKAAGSPFDGSGLASGSWIDTGTPSGEGSVTLLSEQVFSGTADLRHWRLRIATDSPFFPHSPWFSMQGNAPSEADVRTGKVVVSVATGPQPGLDFLLEPGAPNPLVTITSLQYSIPRRGLVRLRVFDVAGRQVAVLADDVKDAGRRTVWWDGRDALGEPASSGLYVARLEFEEVAVSQKILVAR